MNGHRAGSKQDILCDVAGSSAEPKASPSSAPSVALTFVANADAANVQGREVLPEPLSEGLAGWLSLRSAEALDAEDAVSTVVRLQELIGWAQAQQARAVARVEEVLAAEVAAAEVAAAEVVVRGADSDRECDALSLAAAEVGAALRLPHLSATRLVFESGLLVREHPASLARLAGGQVSYPQVRVVLEEAQFVPVQDRPGFEVEALDLARDEELTAAQLGRKVRRMRERRYPETIKHKHRDALDRRRVWLEPAPDGMACLSALIAAEKGLALFDALTTGARARKSAGDERTMDQLRSDLLTGALLATDPLPKSGAGAGTGNPATGDRAWPGASPGTNTPGNPGARDGARSVLLGGSERDPGCDANTAASGEVHPDGDRCTDPDEDLPGMRAEVMVLINAGTLFGADDVPAELNGYGPISADAARRLARTTRYWTGLIQNPATGEILAVGRRRKVPAGLARWLRARDGTCRFPGCSVNTARAQIDHTVPWAHGGPTEHGNLEHLCPKHHRLKTHGYWKARQPEPGTITWQSTLGRIYTTQPELTLKPPGSGAAPPDRAGSGSMAETEPDLKPPVTMAETPPDREGTGSITEAEPGSKPSVTMAETEQGLHDSLRRWSQSIAADRQQKALEAERQRKKTAELNAPPPF